MRDHYQQMMKRKLRNFSFEAVNGSTHCLALDPEVVSCSSDSSGEDSSCDPLIGMIIEVPFDFDLTPRSPVGAKTTEGNDVPLSLSASGQQVRRRSQGDLVEPHKDDASCKTGRGSRRRSTGSIVNEQGSLATTVCLGESFHSRFASSASEGKSDRSIKLPIKSLDKTPQLSFKATRLMTRDIGALPDLLPYVKRD